MIRIKDKSGFEAFIDPSEVSAYGIDPPSSRKFWIIVRDKEYSTTTDIDEHLGQVRSVMKDFNSNKPIKGLSNE